MRRLFAAVVTVACTCGLVVASTGGAASAARARTASNQVRLKIVRSRDGSTAAIAKVFIHGRPYAFLIDTGATKTVVNFALARQLGLKRVGRATKVAGVGCISKSQRVRISNWRIGSQRLPTITGDSVKIPFTGGKAFGLLGSDVLSRFGAVAIDYAHGTLTLA